MQVNILRFPDMLVQLTWKLGYSSKLVFSVHIASASICNLFESQIHKVCMGTTHYSLGRKTKIISIVQNSLLLLWENCFTHSSDNEFHCGFSVWKAQQNGGYLKLFRYCPRRITQDLLKCMHTTVFKNWSTVVSFPDPTWEGGAWVRD